MITRTTANDLDTCDVYRLQNTARDSAGNWNQGYKKVHSGYKFFHHGTKNFDEKLGPIPVVLKRQNLVTSDVGDGPMSLDINAEDVLFITTRDGRTMWMTVVGEPDVRPITGYQTWYMTPTPAPLVYTL